MARQTALPPSLAPRLIGREAAAAYVSVSPALFDDLVRRRMMPSPRLIGERRKAWDVRALDAAVDCLPVEGGEAVADDTWSDVDAA